MKVRKSIGYTYTLLLIGAVVFFTSIYKYANRSDKAFKWVAHTHEAIEKINAVNTSAINMQYCVNRYGTFGNKEYLSNSNAEKLKLQLLLAQLKNLTSDNPVQKKNVRRLEDLVQQLIAIQDPIITAYASPQHTPSLLIELQETSILDAVSNQIALMKQEEEHLLVVRMAVRESDVHAKLLFSVLTGLGTFFLFFIALFRINKENRLRKSAEQAASANEAKYKGLIENSAVIIYTINARGQFTYVSSKVEALTGFHPSELLNKHFTCLIDKEYKKEVGRFYLKQLKQDKPETLLHLRIRAKNGEEKWIVQSMSLMKENGKVTGFQSIVKDMTEKKQAEDKLKEAEQKIRAEQKEYQLRLQAILDYIPMIVYIKDLEGRFIMVNRNFKETLDVTDDMVLGKTIDALQSNTESPANYILADQQVIETLQPQDIEDIVTTRQGKRHVLFTKFPLLDNNNKLFAISGVGKDVTEMVQNRQQLIDARLRAEKAEKLQEEFLANMSHEIRTPMNGIVGMTNMILETNLTESQKEYVHLIKHSSDTLLVLINDILDLSKIKAGRMSVEHIEFQVQEVIDKVLSPIKLNTHQKGIKISTHIDAGVPIWIKGDQHKLEQILNNLLSNAVKFTEAGEISITATTLEQNNDFTTLQFIVSDTGIGIAPDRLQDVFESFVQAGDDMVRRFGGTGLGLAITKRLIELQHGKIQVCSTVGKGSCFTFEIPYLPPEKEKHSLWVITEGSPVNDCTLYGKKILLVEDNHINQKVILHILNKAEMHIDVANNGREAVAMLEQGHQYHLIIMDLQMPKMDGFQATTYIRKKLKNNTPIIAMTASALRNEKIKCFDLGMNEYLTKPFVPADLLKQLNRFLQHETLDVHYTNNIKGIVANESLYCLSYLQEMEDDEYTAEVLQLFLTSTPALLQAMQEHMVYENWEEVYKNAHKLKSSLGIFQMAKLLDDVNEIELSAKDGRRLERVPALIKKVSQQYNLIKPMIEADLDKVKQLSV